MFEEYIQILWGPSPQEENFIDETFPCVLADRDWAAGQVLSIQPTMKRLGTDGAMGVPMAVPKICCK